MKRLNEKLDTYSMLNMIFDVQDDGLYKFNKSKYDTVVNKVRSNMKKLVNDVKSNIKSSKLEAESWRKLKFKINDIETNSSRLASILSYIGNNFKDGDILDPKSKHWEEIDTMVWWYSASDDVGLL